MGSRIAEIRARIEAANEEARMQSDSVFAPRPAADALFDHAPTDLAWLLGVLESARVDSGLLDQAEVDGE